MAFIITCTDKPNSRDLRAATRPDHLAYASEFIDKILVAGPTLDDEGQPNGSVLIMKFDDRAEAEAFCAGDPYAKAGLFASTTIMPWRQTIPKE
ncbi:MAG: YciI family protein [Pseudomonadota bacterium]